MIICLSIPHLFLVLFFSSCEKKTDPRSPEIQIIFEEGITNDGDVVGIGKPLRFKIPAHGQDANLTNFTVEKFFEGNAKTVVDSGLNAGSFSSTVKS